MKARRWESASTNGRRTARSSRSSRPRRAARRITSGSTASKTTAPAASRPRSCAASARSAAAGRSKPSSSTTSSATSTTQTRTRGIHKWLADPDAPARSESWRFSGRPATSRIAKVSASTRCPTARGYIVSVDQLPGESVFHVYRREGEPGRPHDHSEELASFTGGADGTDGLDVTSAPLGPEFPDGLLVAMNSCEPQLPSVPLARHPRSNALR